MIDWLIVVVYVGLFLSWAPPTWTVSTLQVGALLIGAVLLVRQISARKGFRPSPDTWALAAILLWGPIQILTGQTVNAFETWNYSLNWLALVSVYFACRTLLRNSAARERFLSVQVWAGVSVAVISVLFAFSSPTKVFGIFESRFPAFGPFIYKNHFAVFLELLLPVAFYKALSVKRYGWTFIVVFAALFACMVDSLSRGGVLIALGETVVLIAITVGRRQLPLRAVAAVVLSIVVLSFAFTLIVGWEAAWNRFHDSHPFEHRTELALSTIEMIKTRPLTGWGMGTWRTVYPQFALFDIARLANETHNDWLQWTADGGIPFAFVVLFFVLYVSRYAWKEVWGLGVPAVFVHGLVDFPTRSPAIAAFLFMFAGALASVGRTGRKQSAPERSPDWQILSVRTAAK